MWILWTKVLQMYEKCVYKKVLFVFVFVSCIGCAVRNDNCLFRTRTQTYVVIHLKHTVCNDWQRTLYKSVWRHRSLPKRRDLREYVYMWYMWYCTIFCVRIRKICCLYMCAFCSIQKPTTHLWSVFCAIRSFKSSPFHLMKRKRMFRTKYILYIDILL